MEMKQCPNGHFYDQSKTPDCPYCNSASANQNVNRPPYNDTSHGGYMSGADMGVTIPAAPQGGVNPPPQDSDRTVAVIKKAIGIDPVVGWLICVEGKEKGKDYRMHADNNFIGRSEKMDICIHYDDTISRENHAVVSYDMREKTYYFSPGEGRSIIRVNDKAIFSTVQLSAYDKIELGSTKLMFLPLCGEEFNWK